MDDDIEIEPFCIERLWNALQGDRSIVGCNAMITNQQYNKPGKVSEIFFSGNEW